MDCSEGDRMHVHGQHCITQEDDAQEQAGWVPCENCVKELLECPLLNIDHGFSIKTSKGLYSTDSFSQDCLICSVLFLFRNSNTR